MRKLCILLTVLFLCLLIVACGKQENTGTSSIIDLPSTSSSEIDDTSSTLPDEVIDSSTAQSSETTGESVDVSSALSDEVIDSSTVQSSESTDESSSVSNESTSSGAVSGDGNSDVFVDFGPFGCYNGLADYERFMEKYTMPDGFVRYEDVSEFGDINALYFTSDGYEGDYSRYVYCLVDKHGREMGLCIFQNKDDYEPFIVGELTNEDINPTDMRQLKEMKNGIYEIDGMKYQYSDGELYGISWTAAGIGYLLRGISDEYLPSTQETTVVQKLLNLETASDTLKEIFGEELGK